MLSRIIATIRKEVLLRFSSRSELLFFLILPLVFTFLLGGASVEGDSRVPVLVLDEDGGPLAAELVAALEDSASIRPVILQSRQEAEEFFDDEQGRALLTIPAGFGEALQQGEEVALSWLVRPDDTDVLVAEQAVQAAISEVGRALAIANSSVAAAEARQAFADEAAREAYFQDSLAQAQTLLAEAPQRVVITRAAVEEEEDEYSQTAQASAGQLLTWVFIPLLGTSALFAYERSEGTLRRLLSTPTTKSTYLLGTITAQLLIALVQMLLLVGFGIFVLQLDWGRSPLALLVILLSFGLAAVALGVMLGTFIRTVSQANSLSILLGMVMPMLGGAWYPLELFPAGMQTAAKVLPTTWAMQGMTDLVMRGGGLADILPEVAVLLGFAAVFFVIGVARFRYE